MDTAICPSCQQRVSITQRGTCPFCNASLGTLVESQVATVDSLFAGSDADFDFSSPPVVKSTVASQVGQPTRESVAQQHEQRSRHDNRRSHHESTSRSEEPTQSIVAQRGLFWILFRLDGRLPRRVYWCVEVLRWLALQPMVVATEWAIDGTPETENLAKAVLIAISFWIFLAVNVKRWHDRGKSGWWLLVILIPFIGPIWVLIEMGFLRGTRGWNDYGPDPT
jgi:uncharacterized membrane protein YhaH (DUF805 family)